MHPKNSPTSNPGFCDTKSSFSSSLKISVCVIGLAMFASNPWRDLWFYEDIAAHEGFATTNDSYIIGFASQLMATAILFPVALFLIVFGVSRSTRFSIKPRFDRFTWGWGCIASLVGLIMLFIESDYIFYGIRYSHHLDTVACSLAYIAFIYVWWCCSLAHRPSTRNGIIDGLPAT